MNLICIMLDTFRQDHVSFYNQGQPVFAGEADELYHLLDDPQEQTNLIDQHPDQARHLASSFGSYFQRDAAQVAVKGIQGKYELASGGID